MEDIKTFLIYLISLIGLIGASLLFANQSEPPEISSLPATAYLTKISSQVTPSAVDRRDGCADAAQGTIINHIPGISTLSNLGDNYLSISGTIYSSDGITPLPGALVKVIPARPLRERESFVPSHQIRTDKRGRYALITTKSRSHLVLTVHYQDQFSYHNTCLFFMRLNVVSIPLSKSSLLKKFQSSAPALTNLSVDRIIEAGPVIHGPVDIVLPVLPPTPQF